MDRHVVTLPVVMIYAALAVNAALAQPVMPQPKPLVAPEQPPVQAATTATATDVDTLRRQAMADAQQRAAGLPDLGRFALSQIVRLRLENGRIMVHSDLRATPGEARVQVTDLPGLCIVRVQRDGSDDASAPLRVLRFQRFDTSDPHQIQCLADVSAQPGLLTINCGWEGLNGTRSVQLLQHVPVIPNPQRPPLPQIDLFVQGFDDSGEGQRTADLRLTAPDLPTLQQLHRREVEAYLLPALAAVGQQSLLAADPRVAYQVFADALPVDPAVQQKVESILPRLGAHDFEQRQQATADLRDLGTPGALALLRLDRAGLNPEQLSRIDDVLAGYQTLTPAQVQARRDDVAFLLDCLTLDEPALRRLARDRLDQKLGRTIAFDLDAPETVRIRQVESLRAELLPPPATRGSAAQ